MLRFRLLAFLLALPLCVSAFAQEGSRTSMPEERKHWAEVTHQLEAAPLDEYVNQLAEVAVHRIIDVSDFHVMLCGNYFEELGHSNYKYHAQILRLYMLGTAAYQIETEKMDNAGTNVYAFHTVLKGYAVILQQDPKGHDKKLDELAKADADGKLLQLIEKKGCK